jgi:hypothetical protein
LLRRVFLGVIEGAVSLGDSHPEHGIKALHCLTAHYRWAYVHPKAVWFFERQWLVNLILWGNMRGYVMQPWRNWGSTSWHDLAGGVCLRRSCQPID